RELTHKGIRVNGEPVPGSIQWDAHNLVLEFEITDGEKTLPVKYNGVAPDTFSEEVSVVVEGKFDGEIFHAIQIMTKCPSKYEPKQE
ncbi:MAG: cytochrome c maturation protein CcmE, partial [bacterium]|nr:cytochrome c maturation protein CcmE [bacterium]